METSATKCQTPLAGLRIVRATAVDAGTISELVHELAAFENLAAECHLTPEAVERHLLGPGRTAEVLVAWLEEAPVGLAVYYWTFSTFAARPGMFLEDLFVRPRFRHQGIGRALLAEVGRLALRMGAGRFEWTTLKWNENARKLYASIGAKEMSDWTLLRMDAAALGTFACTGNPGMPHAGCHCGGRGSHHKAGMGCNC